MLRLRSIWEASSGGRRQRLARRALLVVLMAFMAFLLAWPVVMLLAGIFRSQPPGEGGHWTLSALRQAYSAGSTYHALANSVIYSASSTTIATVIGVGFAFLSTRTTVRLRRLITPMMLLVLALPTLLYAVSWDLLANPTAGILDSALKSVFGVTPLNAESWGGMIGVQALKLSSFVYFMLVGPFSAMDRTLEEASLASGAGRLRTLLVIDMQVLAPSIFGVMLVAGVFSLGAFDIPQILGDPAGITTLSTQIYELIAASTPPDYAAASALALLMILALAVVAAAQRRVMRGRSYVTVTGRGHAVQRWDLGPRGYIGTVAVALFGVIALLLPGAQVVLTAFEPVVGVTHHLTFANFTAVLQAPTTGAAFRLTLWLAVGGGFAAMVLATTLAYLGRRIGRITAHYFDWLTLLPIAMPGVVLSVGFLWAYITVPGLRDLYGTVWLCAIALIVGVMPVASRGAGGAIAQIGRELEEAAQTAGASGARVLRQIVAPLLKRSFLAGWLVCGVILAGTLDIPLLLLPAPSPNVATLVYGLLYSSGLPTQASAVLVLLMLVIAAIGFIYAVVAYLIRWVLPHMTRRLGAGPDAQARAVTGGLQQLHGG